MEALFEIGQKVVCVDSKGRNTLLTEGKVYTVVGIKKSECCGSIIIGVGIKPIKELTKCTCGNFYEADGYRRQTRFIPLDFDRQADEAIHEALKGQKTLTNS